MGAMRMENPAATNHTPGPWRAENEYVWTVQEDHGSPSCIAVTEDTPIGHHDARLIAAAPDLLAALTLVEKEWRQACDKDVGLAADHSHLRYAMVDARAAITKAVQP